MPAPTNHTIDTASCNGYGRCTVVSVWISAVQEGRRVVLFPPYIMDEKKATYRKPWTVTKADVGNWAIREDPKAFGEGDFQIIADLVPDATEEEARLMAAAPGLLDECKRAALVVRRIAEGDNKALRNALDVAKSLDKAIAAASSDTRATVHDVPQEEMSDWQWTRDHVRNKKILYVLVEDDAQDVARQKLGRDLTEHELYQVKNSLEWGFSESWTDIMEQAVRSAVDHD